MGYYNVGFVNGYLSDLISFSLKRADNYSSRRRGQFIYSETIGYIFLRMFASVSHRALSYIDHISDPAIYSLLNFVLITECEKQKIKSCYIRRIPEPYWEKQNHQLMF